MKLIESASATKVNPKTLKKEKCMIFKFDTGHTFTKWNDVEFFTTKSGNALGKNGVNLMPKMRELAAKGII